MEATTAPAPKPLSKTAQAEAARWAATLPTRTDEGLAGELAYFSGNRLGAAQRRYVEAVKAEIARRSQA